MPAGLTPCTTLGVAPPRSGWVPIPPSNLTNGPCASAGSETNIVRNKQSFVVFVMVIPI
jgi:hypothetical protein